MNVKQINESLLRGDIDKPGVFPHLEILKQARHIFKMDFGLDELPEQPGLILVRGSRQYGKSTWLESRIKKTVEEFGPGSALYLNGDELGSADALAQSLRELLPMFSAKTATRRLFIDEITAIKDWEKGLKRLLDAGELRSVLVVTTGSKATDLRRGSERLPGRKGSLERTAYLFTPVSFKEFRRVCGSFLKKDTLAAYALSGGCPVACGELASSGRLPEYVVAMIRDWIFGECAASGRQRSSLLPVMEVLMQRGGTPLGQARLAREAGLANNTIAAGYVELLADLMCVGLSHPWDETRNIRLLRKPCKYHMINLLAAAAWDPSKPRTVADFRALSPQTQARWLEWLVAQELWRRAAVRGDEFPELSLHWKSKHHELDFVVDLETFIEVKRGHATPLDFAWFAGVFPRARLKVISSDTFETDQIRTLTMEDFLLDE